MTEEPKKTDGTIVRLDNVRLAFPQLFEAVAVMGEGKPSFSATFLLDPKRNAALITHVRQVIKQVATAKWGQKTDQILRGLEATDKICLHNGDAKAQYAGFEDQLYISARTLIKPLVIDRDRVTHLGVADGRPYAGCYVDGSVQVWAQDNKFGKRVNASLRGVQFRKDGDAFAGGAPASVDEFEDLSDYGEGEGAEGGTYA